MNDNKLTRFDTITFKALKKLEKLTLSSNEITDIDGKSFSDLLNLKALLLNNNKLTKIQKSVRFHLMD